MLVNTLLIFSSYAYIFRRVFAFSFVALAPMMAIFLTQTIKGIHKSTAKRAATIMVCFFLLAMISTEIILIVPYDRNPEIVSQNLNQTSAFAASWLKSSNPWVSSYVESLGGPGIYDLFNSFEYINFDMNSTFIYGILNSTSLTQQDFNALSNNHINYIIWASFYTKFPLGFDEYITYPSLSYTQLQKFNSGNEFNRVYDSNDIQIFSINK
jgi:predicted PurR-regulated permease PerM